MFLRGALAFAAGCTLALAALPADAGYKPGESYRQGPDHAPRAAPHRSARHHRVAPCRRDCEDGYRHVYAESWQGFKRVVAPVRRAEFGDQVRLPGGTWVYCERSCEYTLRKQSLDFWEGQGQGFVSPGYFRRDFDLDELGRRFYR
jgi:hypothetical protein